MNEMNEKIMNELKELADKSIKIDPLCYIECRKDGYGKRFCTYLCKDESNSMRSTYKARVWRTGTGYVISIPRNIREALGLKPGDEVTVIIIVNKRERS